MTPYLYTHQNAHAPLRANGKRFWGYPTRPNGTRPRVIVVHTTESAFDQLGADTGAEGVAAYQASVERPSSYHRIVDRDSTMLQLPDEAVAFGAAGVNSLGLHVSLAMRAVDWADPVKAKAARPALERAAADVAEWHHQHGIPVRRITGPQAKDGVAGIVGHGQADPTRRSDPGAQFPWPLFMSLVTKQAATAALPTPVKAQTAPTPFPSLEDDMAAPVLVLVTDRASGRNWVFDLVARSRRAIDAANFKLHQKAGLSYIDDPATVASVMQQYKEVK